MKKGSKKTTDSLRNEYDLSKLEMERGVSTIRALWLAATWF